MRRKQIADRMEVEDPQVKARVLAVLQAISGEKAISQICRETGLQLPQYYKLESQILKGMVMAAQASLTGGLKRNALMDTADLEARNRQLRQDNQRMQGLLRLTRKLFRMGRKPQKTRVSRGRPRKTPLPEESKTVPATTPPNI
jgi:transposase-like protein